MVMESVFQKGASGLGRMRSPFFLPNAEQLSVVSRLGLAYQIFIAAPPADARKSANGCRVIYALDGNACFATLAQTVLMRSFGPSSIASEPVIVVGVGYPTDLSYDMERRIYDYTPPATTLNLSPRPDGTPWPVVGGADEFLAFIDEELSPLVVQEFGADPRRQALFGHSFGGLFVLHTLFTRPALFQRYIAASPSIWWNDRYILEEERAWTESLAARPVDCDLLITVGGMEQTLTSAERARPDWQARLHWKTQNRMIDNARELSRRLGALRNLGLRATHAEFENEDHGSVIPAALSRAVTFAMDR